jgi:hypothetical protein
VFVGAGESGAREGVGGTPLTVVASSGAPASQGVANGVVAVGEGLQPYRPAVTDGPDVGEAVVDLGAARLPAASLAQRCHDVSGELLDLEQLDGEIVDGVVSLFQPLEQSLRAAIGLDGGRDDDVGGAQRPDRPAVARVDRRVDARRELASLGTAPKLSTLPAAVTPRPADRHGFEMRVPVSRSRSRSLDAPEGGRVPVALEQLAGRDGAGMLADLGNRDAQSGVRI